MTMKTQIILFAWLCSGLNLLAQPAQLTREAYRDRVENYSQVLKQQKLKSMASTEGRKIAFTGFLPQIDITGEGTLNLKEMDAWNGPAGQYRNHTYQGAFVVAQPLYTGGSLQARNKVAQADEKLDRLSTELTLRFIIKVMQYTGMLLPPMPCSCPPNNMRTLCSNNSILSKTVLTTE